MTSQKTTYMATSMGNMIAAFIFALAAGEKITLLTLCWIFFWMSILSGLANFVLSLLTVEVNVINKAKIEKEIADIIDKPNDKDDKNK